MGKDVVNLYLSLGSNLGDRKTLLSTAVARLEQRVGRLFAHSSFYETEPWGFDSDHLFLNISVGIYTKMQPLEVLKECKNIEMEMGRSPSIRGVYEDRPIDIDLLFYGDWVIEAPLLVLPHPKLHLRRFVLDPLCEIAPDFMHPVLKKTIRELKERLLFTDKS